MLILNGFKSRSCFESAITLFSVSNGEKAPFFFLAFSEPYFRSDDNHLSSRNDRIFNDLVFVESRELPNPVCNLLQVLPRCRSSASILPPKSGATAVCFKDFTLTLYSMGAILKPKYRRE